MRIGNGGLIQGSQPRSGGPSRTVPGALTARHNWGLRVWGVRIPNTAHPVWDPVQRWIENGLSEKREGQVSPPGFVRSKPKTSRAGRPDKPALAEDNSMCSFSLAHGP